MLVCIVFKIESKWETSQGATSGKWRLKGLQAWRKWDDGSKRSTNPNIIISRGIEVLQTIGK